MRAALLAVVLAVLTSTGAHAVWCRGADGALFEMPEAEYQAGGNRICGPTDPEGDARQARLGKCLAAWYDRTPPARRDAGFQMAYRDCQRRTALR